MADTGNGSSRAIAGLAKPGDHDERNQQGEEHRDGSIDGNRPHIGSHEPGDKGHRQKGGDDGKCRKNCGIPDLIDRPDGGVVVSGETQLQMTIGVFDDHNGIVHENTDGKNESKQRHPVDRVADHHRREERERKSQRNRD